VTVVNYS